MKQVIGATLLACVGGMTGAIVSGLFGFVSNGALSWSHGVAGAAGALSAIGLLLLVETA